MSNIYEKNIRIKQKNIYEYIFLVSPATLNQCEGFCLFTPKFLRYFSFKKHCSKNISGKAKIYDGILYFKRNFASNNLAFMIFFSLFHQIIAFTFLPINMSSSGNNKRRKNHMGTYTTPYGISTNTKSNKRGPFFHVTSFISLKLQFYLIFYDIFLYNFSFPQ